MSYFSLIWNRDDQVLRGVVQGDFVDGNLRFPISFAGRTSDAIALTLRTSARDTQTFETLKSVKFYLTGNESDRVLVQETWPLVGSSQNPPRPELDGGFEISFDRGQTWMRFTRQVGYEGDPSTWILLPAKAMGPQGQDGVLSPFDTAHLMVRFKVPPYAADSKLFDIGLGVDFDVE